MATITFYELRLDDRFRSFTLGDSDDDEAWAYSHPIIEEFVAGTPWAEHWQPPSVRAWDPEFPEGDFGGFLNYGDAVFVVRPEAFEGGDLEVHLGTAGELLPLPYDGREFRVWNVTEPVAAIDSDRTTWMSFGLGLRGEEMRVDPPGRLSSADSTITWIDSPRFWQHRLGSQIFKVPETAHVETYYWELNEPAEEPFRSLVLREGLTGMRFEELYTDEWPF